MDYPELASDLHDIGCFEIEDCGGDNRYELHMESWNKARVSIDSDGDVHVTCAGLSRPSSEYNIEDFTYDMIDAYSAEEILPNIIGFNTWVQPTLSFALETHHPLPTDIIDVDVVDYRGHKQHVTSHQSNALYNNARLLGDITKTVNQASIDYVYNEYGRVISTEERILDIDDEGNPVIYENDNIVYKGVRKNEC